MASAIIHLAIAKKVKEKIDIENPKDYYLGAIAPDIAKQIGETKDKSHFIINTPEGVPNLKIFTKRYPLFRYNSFDLGYYTHLYTDKIWTEEFISKLTENCSIRLLDGTILQTTNEEITNMIYSDYIERGDHRTQEELNAAVAFLEKKKKDVELGGAKLK